MEIFRPERSPSRLTRWMLAVPAAAALLFAATGAHAQECATDADCAPGFECAWAGESNSVTGGGPGPICSDGICDAGETEESCPQDCSLDRTCQVAFQMCNEDEECAPGFYCDDEGGNMSTVGTAVGNTTGSMTYDGTCALLGTTSSTDGGSATDGGAGAASDDTTGSDDGTTGEDSSSNDGAVNTVGGFTATTGLNSGSGGGGNGGPSGGDGGPSGGGGNGHGNGNGHGGTHGHGPWKPWPGHPGCSVGGTGAPAGGLFLTALAGLGAVFMRRRRS